MTMDYKRNHYVPKWYQYRFLPDYLPEKKFNYLDLKPSIRVNPKGQACLRGAIRRWGPRKCFYENDLYTTRFGNWESREIERKFFGKIDDSGREAVEYFTSFEHPSANEDAFMTLLPYMSTQKLRTPKGLAYLTEYVNLDDKNFVLLEMQKLQNLFCALWTECVWSIADASESETKFIA